MAGPMVLATGGSGRTNLTRAFGAGPGLVVIGAAYLGVGMQAGPTVSAVLLYQPSPNWASGAHAWHEIRPACTSRARSRAGSGNQ
jgi:hypothetical protein